MSKGIVAVVGRPNVGKSALFNRLIGRPVAIVEDIPGTTRDRIYGDADWAGRTFTVVDTGGLQVPGPDESGPSATPEALLEHVHRQAAVAIEEADAIVFMVDGKSGLTSTDEELAAQLRRADKPVILAVNKIDNPGRQDALMDFYALGLGDPIGISALHGRGIGDLLDQVVEMLPTDEEADEEDTSVRVAIVGRPNVGKSSLLNALLGEERAIVSEIPGTTRDALDTVLEWEGQRIRLVDTAGIRRRGKIAPGIEKYSVLRALKAIGRAEVVLLLLDATEVATAQDAHVAGYILEEAKSVVVVVNKWDLIEKTPQAMAEYTEYVRNELKFLSYVPVIFVSAKTGRRVDTVIPTVLKVREHRHLRIPTSELNQLVQEAVSRHAPPSKAGKRLKFLYATQVAVDPPTFVFFVNDVRLMHFSYQRFIENRLRERYEFLGTPLKFTFRNREDGATRR